MNKTELVEKIAAGAGISKVDAKKALDATVAAIKDALIAGDKIALVGFGTFSVNERPAREGINPATKEKISIAAKKVAQFKAGAERAEALKEADCKIILRGGLNRCLHVFLSSQHPPIRGHTSDQSRQR